MLNINFPEFGHNFQRTKMNCICVSDYFYTPVNSVSGQYCLKISKRQEITVEIMQLKDAGQEEEGWL